MKFKILDLNPQSFIDTSKFHLKFTLESNEFSSRNITVKIYEPFFGIQFIPGEMTFDTPTNTNYFIEFPVDIISNKEKPNLKNGFKLVVIDNETKKYLYNETHYTHNKAFDIRLNSQERPSSIPRVWIIGDSNVWATFGNDDYRPEYIGNHIPIRVSITSLTLNRFIKGDYLGLLNSLPIAENDTLVFYLGEIDFRFTIHNHIKSKNLDLKNEVTSLMENYKEVISNIKHNYNNRIIVMSPNPPMRDNFLTEYISGDEYNRKLCWDIFNLFWKSQSDVEYLDWTSKYTDTDELIDTNQLCDRNHHIKNYESAIDELSKQLNKITPYTKLTDAKSLVDYCLNFDLMHKCIFMQVYEEILTLSYWLEGFKPHNVLEIGTMGSTFWIISKLSTGKKVSVDIEPRDSIVHHFMHGEDWRFFCGDSHTDEMFNNVRDFCPKYDFIFIDGDHTYDGVKKDFEKYRNLLSPRGVIAFHDIDPNHIFADSYAGQVYKFWQELDEGTKINLVCTKSSGNIKLNGVHSQGFGGIGLWRP